MVALVTPSLMKGGQEAVVCQLAETLFAEDSYSPVVYAAYADGPYVGVLAEHGCAIAF